MDYASFPSAPRSALPAPPPPSPLPRQTRSSFSQTTAANIPLPANTAPFTVVRASARIGSTRTTSASAMYTDTSTFTGARVAVSSVADVLRKRADSPPRPALHRSSLGRCPAPTLVHPTSPLARRIPRAASSSQHQTPIYTPYAHAPSLPTRGHRSPGWQACTTYVSRARRQWHIVHLACTPSHVAAPAALTTIAAHIHLTRARR
ncbi:hypothetical protein DFH06DRAFT_1317418 [Mycena polygramma]|nr:hypothetical protein DFH06DRAFT_1317418 [Mycena polygramma]